MPFALETRIARSFAVFDTSKKRGKSKANALCHVLKHLAVHSAKLRVRLFPQGKGVGLFAIVWRLAMQFMVVLAPIEQAIVDLAAHVKRLAQFRFLRRRRI